MAEILKRRDIGRVRIHREQTLGDDQDRIRLVARADAVEVPPNRVNVQVAVEMDIARCRGRAILKARMRETIDDDMVVAPHQPLYDAVSRGPARRIEDGMLDLQEFRDAPLQRERIPRVAEERSRAGAVDAIFVDRRDRGCLDRRDARRG